MPLWRDAPCPRCVESWPNHLTVGGDIVTKKRFKRGDHVSWNSEAGRVRGRITRVVTTNITFKGYTVHATREEPQYEIKSDKTDHVAMHKGSALRRLTG
jgi:hypothetical protein